MATFPEIGSTSLTLQGANRPDYYARYFGDPVSRLFWYDGHLHLGILPSHAAFFKGLIQDGTTATLVSDGLTAGCNRTAPVYSLFEDVYRLAVTPRIIYWYEWSPDMLRDAALHMIRLLGTLLDRNLTLRNPHPWNLLYDGRKFQYMNPGSIVSFDREQFRRAWDKVLVFLIRPTLLATQGKFTAFRSMLRDIHHGVPQEIVADGDWQVPCFDRQGLQAWLARGLIQLETLPPSTTGTRWLGYHAHEHFEREPSWIRKQLTLERFLREEKPASVLDLAANSGHYARMAAVRGCETIGTDIDDTLVDQIFHGSQQTDCALYPAVFDFTNPTPASGIGYRWFRAATERMRSELVIGYALVHHLVLGRYRLDFDEVAAGFANLSSKAALIEYVPYAVAPSWYPIENLTLAFTKFFASVEVLPGSTEDRQLIVCKGRFLAKTEC